MPHIPYTPDVALAKMCDASGGLVPTHELRSVCVVVLSLGFSFDELLAGLARYRTDAERKVAESIAFRDWLAVIDPKELPA